MRVLLMVLLAALTGCAHRVEPRPIGKGKLYIEAFDLDRALDDGAAYCVQRGKSFVAGRMERETRSHPASLTFTCQ